MKLNKLSTLLAATTLLATSSAAMAWESGDHSTSASVALSSDYMWRGVTQTDNEPSISGSFDYAHASGFYAGTWASNVDFGDSVSTEIDIYAGFGNDIGDTGFSYDVSVLRYIYPDSKPDYSWNEYAASVGYSFFSFGIAYSDDVYGTDEDGIYYSIGFDYDLPMDIALSAGYGFYDYDNATGLKDAADYRIGISKEMIGFGFDLTYVDTDKDNETNWGKAATDGRVVFTISKSM
jgi:uncharacterized protein (TIGR02001 family)